MRGRTRVHVVSLVHAWRLRVGPGRVALGLGRRDRLVHGSLGRGHGLVVSVPKKIFQVKSFPPKQINIFYTCTCRSRSARCVLLATILARTRRRTAGCSLRLLLRWRWRICCSWAPESYPCCSRRRFGCSCCGCASIAAAAVAAEDPSRCIPWTLADRRESPWSCKGRRTTRKGQSRRTVVSKTTAIKICSSFSNIKLLPFSCP